MCACQTSCSHDVVRLFTVGSSGDEGRGVEFQTRRMVPVDDSVVRVHNQRCVFGPNRPPNLRERDRERLQLNVGSHICWPNSALGRFHTSVTCLKFIGLNKKKNLIFLLHGGLIQII